jgi:hypothetical protein
MFLSLSCNLDELDGFYALVRHAFFSVGATILACLTTLAQFVASASVTVAIVCSYAATFVVFDTTLITQFHAFLALPRIQLVAVAWFFRASEAAFIVFLAFDTKVLALLARVLSVSSWSLI